MEYVKCNLCDSRESELFKEINGYQLVKCKHCGLIYLNPRPNHQELNKIYSAAYHIEKILKQDPKTDKAVEIEINKYIGRATEIVNQFGKKGKLLDIGCSAGFFLACLKKYGWDVTGVEISQWASNFARKKLGLKVYTGKVEDVNFSDQFDVITMYHVLEHLPNPSNTLEKVYDILDTNGVLIINGPNFASFDRIWHGKEWRGYDLPFHLYHFTPDTYRAFLEKTGFSVQKIKFQYWNPVIHLMEIGLGDGIKADHPPETVKVSDNSIFLKSINKVGFILAKLLNLKGRDLTIYAKKRNEL